MNKITAILTTIPSRERMLPDVTNSILDQVDVLKIIFNGYTKIPTSVNKKKIASYLNSSNENAHDTVWSHVVDEGYYFIVDDDIIYPQNYVRSMVKEIEKLNRSVVVVVHGANVKFPTEDYKKSRSVIHFKNELKRSSFVDMGGCGTLAFHTQTIRPQLKDFPFPFCRDLWFSILAHKQNVPILCISRPSSWLIPLKTSDVTVWDKTTKDRSLWTRKNCILKDVLSPLVRNTLSGK